MNRRTGRTPAGNGQGANPYNPAYYQSPAPGYGYAAVSPGEAEEIAREYWKLSRNRLWIIRIVGILAIAAVAVAALFALGVLKAGGLKSEPGVKGFELKDIGELATESATFSMTVPVETYREEQIFGYSFTVPGTKNTHFITYNALVKAGLDFSQVEMKADDAAKKITLKMPEIRVLSTEVYFAGREGGDNPLSMLPPEEAEQIRKDVVPDAEKTAREGGTLDRARESAESLISRLLAGAYDMNVYTVEYQWP